MLRKGGRKLVCDMQESGQPYNLNEDPAKVHILFGNVQFATKQMELPEIFIDLKNLNH